MTNPTKDKVKNSINNSNKIDNNKTHNFSKEQEDEIRSNPTSIANNNDTNDAYQFTKEQEVEIRSNLTKDKITNITNNDTNDAYQFTKEQEDEIREFVRSVLSIKSSNTELDEYTSEYENLDEDFIADVDFTDTDDDINPNLDIS